MDLGRLKEIYRKDNRTSIIAQALEKERPRVRIEGIAGSSEAFIASALIEETGKPFLFILSDKEEAAYFLNDLQNLNPGRDFLFLPASYRVPYHTEMVDNANIALRTEALNEWRKRRKKAPVCVTYPEALAEKVVTRKSLEKNTLKLSVGDKLSIDFINETLEEYDFERVDFVYEPGQFSIRGGILDIFSFAEENPYRIEFFGDELESIRKFNPVDQLSIAKLDSVVVIPNVQQRMESEERQDFLEFVGRDTTIWLRDLTLTKDLVEKDFNKAEEAYEKLDSILEHTKPDELYTSGESFLRQITEHALITTSRDEEFGNALRIEYSHSPQPSFNKNFELLTQELQEKGDQGFVNLIFSSNPKQIERLERIFKDLGSKVDFHPIRQEIAMGFIDKDFKLCCYTDHQIFERYHRFYLKEGFRRSKEALTLKELNSLEPGDFVVHIDHGIGKFSGLEKIDSNGKEQEAIRLIYKDGDILYVSIHSLHRISKYTGKEGIQPKINKLGSASWQKLKSKTKRKVKQIAYDLIKLYAKRKASKGHAFAPDNYLQTELEASFMYEDTPDQNKATQDVKADMESETPMDRLICGDVGFGKTEIAMRAAFKAVCDSKQVAVLVPTTILSLQHFRSFTQRLKDFPCNIAFLNRFVSGKKQTETLKKLESGEIDIVIGTHKLVGKQVKFKDLGLLVVDEEQKFGVSVKDKLKTLRENVDTLTLTATPIPRTLQFSLMSARDLSIISTPPPNRYPVHTEVRPFNEEVIRDAIQYEVSRGGQVYFVHNKIQNIKEVAGMVQRLCPDVKVAIGHGQMKGEDLERVMTDFIDGLYDVLIATTIIESGIDIPNANTMIINQAQNFGLSDLHQLRGRVGRSNKRAFCVLLAPPFSVLPREARKRLQAIEQFSDLGSGMNIAMRDLDIRGAGDLLGAEQSGFINDIGFDTYQKILDEAVAELKNTEFKELYKDETSKQFVQDCQIETDFEILIPDSYISQISERLSIYRELDEIQSESQLEDYKMKLEDRFGDIPPQTHELFDAIRLRWLAREIGFEKIVLKKGKMIGFFIANKESDFYQSEDFGRILQFLKNAPLSYKMYEKNDVLRLSHPDVSNVKEAIDLLQPIVQTESVIS